MATTNIERNLPGVRRLDAAFFLSPGITIGLFCAFACFSWSPSPSRAADNPAGIEFFDKRVRPVLVQHCYKCHSVASGKAKGGLQLDSRPAIRKGGRSGPAVVPGRPEKSVLVKAVRHESFEMPPGKPLPAAVVADLVEWIRTGAADPRERPPEPVVSAEWEKLYQQRRTWWSLQPVVFPVIPAVRDTRWSALPIDRFVLARLEQAGLRPAARANRRALARRLSFALTGLPPEPEMVERFATDRTPQAMAVLVDRLLASPHFGERWARHWMDVVRYTDTYGYEWDIPAKGAWRYRDYLVRAFNDDIPFDQLLREQIAGDLLEQPRINPVRKINESRIGPMFFQMGEKRHGDSVEFNGIHQEMLDNKIDAFSKAFQATTVTCARCHDHKLDAITQREYYALAGVFMSSRWVSNTVDLPTRDEAIRKELKAIKTCLQPLLARLWQADTHSLTAERWRHLVKARGKTEPTLEDPLYPWFWLRQAVDSGKSVPEAWKALGERYRQEHRQRHDRNAGQYTLVADLRQGMPPDWSIDGAGLREIVPCGDFTVSLQGDTAVGQLLHGGLATHSLSPRLNGAVRTPYLSTFASGHLSLEVAGGDFSAARTVIDNAFLTERQRYLRNRHPAWQTVAVLPAWKDHHVFYELATKTSNPNFPPRVGLGGACSEQQTADPRSWFTLTRIYRHHGTAPPADELARFLPLLEGEAPKTQEAAARHYGNWVRSAIEAWGANRPGDEEVRLVNWLLDAGLLTNRRGVSSIPDITALVGQYRKTEAALAEPWTVNGMADVEPGFDYRVNLRGDYDQLGPAVPRGYLRALLPSSAGEEVRFATSHSGRRELAERIASPHNPLTARVFVNRVWHWLFGAGLVATPDDFGHAGEKPSHPALLDYLASRFVTEGWSLKKLVREIVLSETWQQGQSAQPGALTIDPTNRLLHHYPVRRLEAEPIRDAILFVSGALDEQLFGPSINPHRQKEDPEKRLFSGPLDGAARRSIYTKITIMEPPRFLAVFNQPTPKIPTGKRDVTATPAQSLALLNDPFVIAQAEHWSRRLVEDTAETAEQRIVRMFRRALGREPTSEEARRWTAAVGDLAREHRLAEAEWMRSVLLWRDVAHALFSTKEFLYVR
jgi:hypothetical protein